MNFSAKEKKIHKDGKERAKQADYEGYVKAGAAVKTWSATHKPDYGTRPIDCHKICLCCRKEWPANTERTHCDCEAGGFLYGAGMVYQKKVGGGSETEAVPGDTIEGQGISGWGEGI